MPDFEFIFQLIGLEAALYAVARLLFFVSLKLRDENGSSVPSTILICLYGLLCVCALPVTIVFGLIDKLYTRRTYEKHQKNMSSLYWVTKMESEPVEQQIRDARALFNYHDINGFNFAFFKDKIYKEIDFRQ